MSHYVFIILTGADLQRPAEADGFQYMAAADGIIIGQIGQGTCHAHDAVKTSRRER